MLAASRAALFVVDYQERLFAAMPEGIRDQALKNVDNLLYLAHEKGMPVVATEQYPKGLGPTLSSLGITAAFPKLCFSALDADGVAEAMEPLKGRTIILVGMETHICVSQTAQALLREGYPVVVVADACLSRRKLDWELGLGRMEGLGATLMSTEAVLFELLGAAGGPVFKEISRRIR